MNEFANYKNGRITINTYRFPDADITDVDDILNAVQTESVLILAASINTKEEKAAIEAVKKSEWA